jgi:hypothetical protein
MTAERPSEPLLPFRLFDDEADVAGTVAFITSPSDVA